MDNDDCLEFEENLLYDEDTRVSSHQMKNNTSLTDDVNSSEVDDHSGLVLPSGFEEEDELFLVQDNEENDDAESTEGRNNNTDDELHLSAGIDIKRASSTSGSHLGTPHSNVGSLKEFGYIPSAHVPLGGGAASLPSKSFMEEAYKLHSMPSGAEDASILGTSMPIKIPRLQRKLSVPNSTGQKGFGPGFVPPHLLDAEDEDDPDFLLSASASVKREKLMARNAILRSTGFIEVHSAAAPSTGEIFDAVKDSLHGVSGVSS